MSGQPCPEKSIKSALFRRVRSRLFTSVHGVSVVVLWSALCAEFARNRRSKPAAPNAKETRLAALNSDFPFGQEGLSDEPQTTNAKDENYHQNAEAKAALSLSGIHSRGVDLSGLTRIHRYRISVKTLQTNTPGVIRSPIARRLFHVKREGYVLWGGAERRPRPSLQSGPRLPAAQSGTASHARTSYCPNCRGTLERGVHSCRRLETFRVDRTARHR